MLVFIRGINPHFELNEELLSVDPLKEATTGQDLFNAVENCNWVGVEHDGKCNNR